MRKKDVNHPYYYDEKKEFSSEETQKWCSENFLPLNFFEMTVKERREALMIAQKKLWQKENNPL